MTEHLGRFVWYDLMTTDPQAAAAFYGDVIGWRTRDSGLPDRSYTILLAGETGVGGLMALPPEACAAGARPGWKGYIAGGEVDSAVGRVKQAGGTVHHAPEDIPGIGRFAVVADPHGAVFTLFHGASAPPPPLPPGMPGTIGWHELQAGDMESAFAFYSTLFGWTKDHAFDMGAMGTYQIFAQGGVPIGGMMTRSAAVPMPFWLYYFNVDAIDAAVARTTERGGALINGPMEVPGGLWVAQCRDPQGAMFAMVAPRR
ncbi:MAG: VOC family protein [Rhodospirillales bacterium]|nr:VOC family protein [Rhodospirillales bacterium]